MKIETPCSRIGFFPFDVHFHTRRGGKWFMDLKPEIRFSIITYITDHLAISHWWCRICYTKQMLHLVFDAILCRRKNFLSCWWWSNKFMCSLWSISMLIYYQREARKVDDIRRRWRKGSRMYEYVWVWNSGKSSSYHVICTLLQNVVLLVNKL